MVTMITGWPSSLGLKSKESMSPLEAFRIVDVAHMEYNGLRDGLSTLIAVTGLALFTLAPETAPTAPTVLLRLPVGVRLLSGVLVPEA